MNLRCKCLKILWKATTMHEESQCIQYFSTYALNNSALLQFGGDGPVFFTDEGREIYCFTNTWLHVYKASDRTETLKLQTRKGATGASERKATKRKFIVFFHLVQYRVLVFSVSKCISLVLV